MNYDIVGAGIFVTLYTTGWCAWLLAYNSKYTTRKSLYKTKYITLQRKVKDSHEFYYDLTQKWHPISRLEEVILEEDFSLNNVPWVANKNN